VSPSSRSHKKPKRRNWLFPATMLVFVFGVLLMAAVLQVPAEDADSQVALDRLDLPSADDSPYAPAESQETQTLSSPAAKNTPAPRIEAQRELGRRVERDLQRIAAHRASYTLQISVACDPKNARQLLVDSDGDDRFYLLPVQLNERACFRICWGIYPDRSTAEKANDMPAALRARIQESAPRPISGLLP
jgi:septal ring-binding cell division protein DamX